MKKAASPGINDIPEHLATVPDNYREAVCEMSVAMIHHEAYANPDYQWSTDNFELGAPLGRGKFGRVYVAREKKTHFMVAMKVLFKSELRAGRVERQVLRELEIQSNLIHRHILRMYTWFHDESRIYFVLELASEGELYGHLKKSPNGRFNEPRSARYTYQVADALAYCHKHGVIHRDLKPENILLTSSDDIKLADFGWSAHTMSNTRKTMCGTLDYLPPEMVHGTSYNSAVDQWCLGILCYEFLVGKPPFEAESTNDTYKRIAKLDIHYPSYMSTGAKDLISKLLRIDSKQRITLENVMRHPWIKANNNLK